METQYIRWQADGESAVGRAAGATVPVDIRAGCVRLEGHLAVAPVEAGLVDLVPVARCLTDAAVAQVVERLAERSTPISCQAGCCACCSYLIPVSPPEALAIWRDVLRMPAPYREDAVTDFLRALRTIGEHPPPDLDGLDEPEVLQGLSEWYGSLDMPCPLLTDQLCSLYAARPLVCRECIMTLPAEVCGRPQVDVGDRVAMPVSVAEVLYETAGLMLGRPPESVILATLPRWIDLASEAYEQTWPAEDLAHCFAATLHRHVDRSRRQLADRTDERTTAASA
ncbi:MAG: hypothetical protein GVY16_04975 [Planctomycetes bacterium]|jgi:Fe-S-cluster containining protein|nr:YkgJ family cysteine cluster protein [Phycisphaerae bacterium]NBB95076.1 hypothetical protein [Planctomycetota bacterium]